MERSQAIIAGNTDADPGRNLTIPLSQNASRKRRREAREKI